MPQDNSTGSHPLCSEIIERIAKLKGVDPLDLQPRLSDVIDPDALEQVFDSRSNGTARRGGYLEFRYSGYRVSIRGDGELSIEPMNE